MSRKVDDADCSETLTASGHARWGGNSDVVYALSNRRRTWRSRWHDESRSVDAFMLSFQLGDRKPDRVWFASELERSNYLKSNLTNRTIEGEASHLLGSCREWWDNYVGDRLVGVWFVGDYLQLQFDRGVSNFYVWPQVRTEFVSLDFGDPGYRDGLCGLIWQTVRYAEVFLDDGFVIGFDAGELAVSPEQMRSASDPDIIGGHGHILGETQLPFE